MSGGTLDRLERLHAEATAKPWAVDPAETCEFGAATEGSEGEWSQVVGETRDEDDASLIAEARNALPALLAVARAAERLCADKQGVYLGIRGQYADLIDALAVLGEGPAVGYLAGSGAASRKPGEPERADPSPNA